MKIEGPLEPEALRILRAFPEADAQQGPDAVLRVGDQTYVLEVKYQRRIGAADAWEIVRQLRDYAADGTAVFLGIADRTTEEARRILTENDVAYIDAIGNAHFDLPGAFVHVERLQPKHEPRGTTGKPKLAGKAGIAAQALLLEPDREWRVTDLAKRADISVGQAHAVLDRLEDLHIVEAQGTGRVAARRVVNPTALLDTWVEENRDRGVRRLGVYLLPPRDGDPAATAAQRLGQHKIEHALTGVAAAAELAPFLTTVPVATFWIDNAQPLEDVAEILQADPADRGANIVLMQANDNTPLVFVEERNDLRLANPFRIYHDARRDPKRGAEQAEHFRKEIIGW